MHTVCLTEENSLENFHGHQENAADAPLPTHCFLPLWPTRQELVDISVVQPYSICPKLDSVQSRRSSQCTASPFRLQSKKVSNPLFYRLICFFMKILLSPYSESILSGLFLSISKFTFHFGICLPSSKAFKHTLFCFFQLELASSSLSIRSLKKIFIPLFSALLQNAIPLDSKYPKDGGAIFIFVCPPPSTVPDIYCMWSIGVQWQKEWVNREITLEGIITIQRAIYSFLVIFSFTTLSKIVFVFWWPHLPPCESHFLYVCMFECMCIAC